MGQSNTIGELIALRLSCWLHCDSCRHNRKADLPALAERLGPDLPMSRAALRMRCSACGARDVSITIAHEGGGSLGNNGRKP